MSESLFLINPKKRKKSRKGRMPPGLRRYWATHRRGGHKKRRKSHARSRRKARAIVVMPNPHRRRHRRNARRHHKRHVRVRYVKVNARRRHRRSNPFSMGRGVFRQYLVPAGIGAAGAVALDIVYASAHPYLPTTLQQGWFATLTKLGGALAIGWGASKILGRERGKVVALGALTVVGYGVVKQIAQQFMPTLPGLSGYADFVNYQVGTKPSGVGAYIPGKFGRLGFMSPAAVIQPGQGVGAYMRGSQPMGGFADPSGYDYRSDGM